MQNGIEKQLQGARERLLDLTLHNRLLNFRPTQRRTIKVIDEIPNEVFDILVLHERVMQFKPSEQPAEDTESLFADEDIAALPWWDATEPEQHHIDRLLQTELTKEELQKRLYYIYQQARSVFEEQGYSVLYLALGYLEWTEDANAEQTNSAPLILIPVELERQKVRTRFSLRWSGAELFPNLSLQAKLSELSVELPILETPEDKTELDAYFQKVGEAVSEHENWRVVPHIYLDFFSFTKFVMYKDLEPEAWTVDSHPLLGTILGQTAGNSGAGDGFKPEEVDLGLPSQNVYHVMDADSSQIAVIEDIKSGKNLVVEGPPGTGKSQTITNIIAELLAAGKNVLFVSEKMAALEVVKSRLDKVGLGDFCLELHSHKSNKREVLNELQRTLSVQPLQEMPQEDVFAQIDNKKAELNAYVSAIQEPIGVTQKSPFTLFGIREAAHRHFEKAEKQMLHITFETDPTTCTPADWQTAVQRLENLAVILPRVMPLGEHPWRGCKPGTITPLVEREINTLIEACKTALNTLEVEIDSLTELCGICSPATLEDLSNALQAADVMAQARPVELQVLTNEAWNTSNDDAQRLIQTVEAGKKALKSAREKFTEAALKQDIAALLDEYKQLSGKFFLLRMLNSRYRSISREFRNCYLKTATSRNPTQISADFSKLANCIDLQQKIKRQEQTGRSLFGSEWRGEESDLERLTEFSEWIVKFRQQLLSGVFTERAVEIASTGISEEQVQVHIKALQTALNDFVTQRDALLNLLGTDIHTLFGIEAEKLTFTELRARLEEWQEKRDALHYWAQFVTRRDVCRDSTASSLLERIAEIAPEDLVQCFEGNLADALLHNAFLERSALGNFVQDSHEKKIEDFYKLDSECIKLNQQRLAYELYQSQPRLMNGASPDSEIGILQGQFNRKRGHLPIRKLLSVAGSLIQKIKPCFMMSPLSVAQFCDPAIVNFDVIVFDEASQIRPEDALGTLLRGKQAVVIGDTKQLPPTSFFDHIVEDTDEDEDDMTTAIVDVESILHQCKLSFPTKALRWHYRSRHESLIAVSNQEFYDNNLQIFPSPIDSAAHLGLKFIHLPDAVYDRGRSSVNRKEAQAVVQAAFEHYREYPDKSLGIGTFNIKQQQAILDEVERQLRQNPEMEEYFASSRDEHFFVKNLETIQGDERDAIFLSIGYGFDQDRRLHKNFGPLNHEGGQRRLNVLITRARERCVVFSNFRASDLQLDANAPSGTQALKVFLDYAENRNLQSVLPTGADTDSPFEDAVYEFLTSHGYTVSKQVGCAGYRIDLAVVDAKAPGRYLLGIECDGAQYHSSPVARDRDRLRQQVLEGLGWTLHRIWSTDWYRNRADTGKRLLKAVERAKLSEMTVPIKPAVQPTKQEPVNPASDEPTEPPVYEACPKVPDYVECTDLGIPIDGELHKKDPVELAIAITRVVRIESPVHTDEAVSRIRSLWGLKKAGKRIKDAIESGVADAQRSGTVRREGEFLWWAVEELEIPMRRRAKPRIEWLCDEEITEAMRMVLTSQGAISPDALITEAAKLFGYKSTGTKIPKRMKPLLDKLIRDGIFRKAANNMINLR